MQLLEGKVLAEKIKENIRTSVNMIVRQSGKPPKLVAVLSGENQGARIYAEAQAKTAQNLGIDYELVIVPETVSQESIEQTVCELNQSPQVNGIILQMPLPSHLNTERLIRLLSPQKDVEGIVPENLGLLALGKARIFPCTPKAAMELIESTGVSLKGKEAVVVGASSIVGRPMGLLLIEKQVTTTIARSAAFQNGSLEQYVRRADVLVVAVGKPKIIPGDWIKEGAIVIDVGINRQNGQVVGDVDFERAQKKAAFITPVPGGVGPLTVTILMQNVIQAFYWQRNEKIF